MKLLLVTLASAFAFAEAHASTCTPPNAAQFTNQKGEVCQVRVQCGKAKPAVKGKVKKPKKKVKRKVTPKAEVVEQSCPPTTVINNYYAAPEAIPYDPIEIRQPENLPDAASLPEPRMQVSTSPPFFGFGSAGTPYGFGAGRTQYVQLDTRPAPPSTPMPTPLPASGLLFGTVSALFSGWKLSKLRKVSI